MAKEKPKQQEVVGWYQPHIAVEWTGEVLDPITGELVKEPSMTKQSHKDECDINIIVRRFLAGEEITHVNRAAAQGLYTDLPDSIDLQASLELVRQAEAGFMALPAHVRAQFDNSPLLFVDHVNRAQAGDQAAQANLVEWGVATDNRPPPPPPKSPEELPQELPLTPPPK